MKTLLMIAALLPCFAFAQLDKDSQKGLEDTKALLKNSTERQKAIDKDPKAKDVDNKVNALTGNSGTKEDVYGIASEVFEKVAEEAKGDPNKMQQLMLEAQQNPQKFYEKYFTESFMGDILRIILI